MDRIYLDKIFEDTKQIISILTNFNIGKDHQHHENNQPDILVHQLHLVDINLLEQDGVQPSPTFIRMICEWATFLESVRFPTLERMCLNAKACHDTYLKNSNPMGFLFMLSKLLPALECPHTILTTGPVRKRLLTMRAKLLLFNFMASHSLLMKGLQEHSDSTAQCEHCELCKKNIISDGLAHISGPEHTKKVVEKYNIEHLETFGYTVNKSTRAPTSTPTKKKMNQLREGVKMMSIQEKEQIVPSSSSGGRTETLSSNKKNEHNAPSSCASSTKVHAADATERSERFQECGSTPPASSSSQEGAAATDGATARTGQGSSRSRICWNCHAQGRLLKCSGCMKAWYCGQQCQEADWARHGGYCEARMRKRRLAEVD